MRFITPTNSHEYASGTQSVTWSEMLCVDRMTNQAISCIANNISTMCPNRLKYLTLLRGIASFVCSSTEQQGSPESSRYCYWGVVKHLKQLTL